MAKKVSKNKGKGKGAHLPEVGKATRFAVGDGRPRPGRPKTLPRMKELMKALLGGSSDTPIEETPIAVIVQELIKEVKNHKLGAQRVAAANTLLDRAFGKVKSSEFMDNEDGGEPQVITGFNRKKTKQ